MALRQVTVDQAIDFLNDLVKMDRSFVATLVRTKHECNEDVLNHSTVQVTYGRGASEISAGFLGVLNGLFGTLDVGVYAGWGPIAAVYDDDGRLTHFQRTGT